MIKVGEVFGSVPKGVFVLKARFMHGDASFYEEQTFEFDNAEDAERAAKTVRAIKSLSWNDGRNKEMIEAAPGYMELFTSYETVEDWEMDMGEDYWPTDRTNYGPTRLTNYEFYYIDESGDKHAVEIVDG